MFLLRISSRQDYDQTQNRLRGSRTAQPTSPRNNTKRTPDTYSKRGSFIRGSRFKKRIPKTTKRPNLDARQDKKAIPSIDELLRMVSDAERTGDWYDMTERSIPRKNTWSRSNQEKKVRTSRTPRPRKKERFEESFTSRRDPTRSSNRNKKSRWDDRGIYGGNIQDSERSRPVYSEYTGSR